MKNGTLKLFTLMLAAVMAVIMTCGIAVSARADEVTYTEADLYQLQVLERADALYASIKEANDGDFSNYISKLMRDKQSYETTLRDTAQFNQWVDAEIDFTTSLFSLMVSAALSDVTSDLGTMAGLTEDDQAVMDMMDMANQYLDVAFGELEKPVLPKISQDEFIFEQAWAGSKNMVINDLFTVKNRVEWNDGHFDTYEHAVEFIDIVQRNKLGLSALKMGKAHCVDLMNMPIENYVAEILKDWLISDVLSKMQMSVLVTPEMRAKAYTYVWDSIVAIVQLHNNEHLRTWEYEVSQINAETRRLLAYDPSNPPELPRYQTVTLVCDNAVLRSDSIEVRVGYGYWDLPYPYRFGYTFEGWYDDPEAGNEYYNSDICQTDEPITLYGRFAHTVSLRGSCGENLTYVLYKDGILELTGTGAMTTAPWTENEQTRGMVAEAILPEGLTAICDGAFDSCEYMHSISLPSSLRSIGDYAFAESGLTSLILPSGLTHIGAGMLLGADHVTELTIPASVSSVGFRFVEGGAGGESYEVSTPYSPSHYCGPLTFSEVDRLTFASGRTALPEGVCCNMPELDSVSIPSSVHTIGSYAFFGCRDLTSVSLPDAVTSIGDYAFAGSYGDVYARSTDTDFDWAGGGNLNAGLESLTLPPNVVTLGKCLLSGNTAVTELTIPATVTGGEDILSESGVKNVTLASGMTRICDGMLKNAASLTDVSIPETVTEIGDCAFQMDNALKAISLPSGLTGIGDRAFACTGLEELILPKGLTELGDAVLENVYTVYDLTLPGNLGTLTRDEITGENCLTGSNVYVLIIGEGITEIGDWALSDLPALDHVELPTTMERIGANAFRNDTYLNYIDGATVALEVGENAFLNTNVRPHLVVDQYELTMETSGNDILQVEYLMLAYENLAGTEELRTWGEDGIVEASFEPAPRGTIQLTALKAGSTYVDFFNGSWTDPLFVVTVLNGKTLRLPTGLTRVEADAFRASDAEHVYLPDGVEFIGAGAFAEMDQLLTVRIPGSVVTIEEGAFDECPNVRFILAPDSGAGWNYAAEHDIEFVYEDP